MQPCRVQLSRRKGWRMPPNTVKVDRSTRHGNQFLILAADDGRFVITRWADDWRFGTDLRGDATFADSLEEARAEAVRRFRDWLQSEHGDLYRNGIARDLAGRNLACWCPLDHPCHADVLLAAANHEERTTNGRSHR